MRFLVHGSIAYDLLLQYDGSFPDALDVKHLEDLSVSFFCPHFARHHGGTGANIAWNLRLLGQEVFPIGTVGHDGGPYLALMRERGIATDYIEELSDHVTAVAIIGTDNGERQITFFHPGADAHGSLPDFSGSAPDVSYAIVGARNPTLMLSGAKQCRDLGIPYLFDPGQQSHTLPQDEFRRVVERSSGLIVNEYEWKLAHKALDWSEKDVIAKCGLLIITSGGEGARLLTPDEDIHIAACKAEQLVNPTGAGDAFRAGILVGLASKWSLEQTGQLASAMGSFVVESEGTLLDTLDLERLQSRIKETYGAGLPVID